ncbi:FAD-binding oxidoreductase [candidate division KSB1 bacterium]|nr:FAD-binding oxidoreductase [candidate division KSB1 bacterium]
MSTLVEHTLRLAELAGAALRQTEPWPVVAPRTVELLSDIVRYARDERLRILVLGTGSSFESTFALERENVLAVMMYGFAATELLSAHELRVGAGVSADLLGSDGGVAPRRTMGGLLSDSASPASFAVREALGGRLRAIELMNSRGELVVLRGIGQGNGSQPALAPLVMGAGGRLGIVVAVRLATGTMDVAASPAEQRHSRTMAPNRDAAVLRADLCPLFDPDGVFAW